MTRRNPSDTEIAPATDKEIANIESLALPETVISSRMVLRLITRIKAEQSRAEVIKKQRDKLFSMLSDAQAILSLPQSKE